MKERTKNATKLIISWIIGCTIAQLITRGDIVVPIILTTGFICGVIVTTYTINKIDDKRVKTT